MVGNMRGCDTTDGDVVAKFAATVVSQMELKLADVISAVRTALAEEFAEIGGNGELLELLHDAVEGNLDAYIPAIRHSIPIEHIRPPTAALEHARRMAQRGVPANTLVRGYRLGHQALLDQLVDEIHQLDLDAQLGLDVFQHLSAVSFGYVDRIMEDVLASHQRERDRWLTNKNRLRELRVQEVLDDADADFDEMTRAVGYPFGLTHLALGVWRDRPATGDELPNLERFASRLGEVVDSRYRPLFIAADGLTAWVWLVIPESDVAETVTRAREFVHSLPDAPWVVCGVPASGPHGFRRSHRQALDVRTAVLASRAKPSRFTAASDPGVQVAVRFSGDLVETRRWVSAVLGDLASMTDSDERLRETLRVFLQLGSSFKATADGMHLHVNSVKYRVQRAVERRGRDVADDRLDVEVALMLVHWFGDAILVPADE